MKKMILAIICMMIPAFAAMAQDVIGKWKLETGTAIVEVYQNGDIFNGKIVWLETPTEPDGSPAVDENNPDVKLRKRPLIGLNMLHGLKKDGSKYSGGKIYDPENGKTYNCSMEVNGDLLKVRGSLDARGIIGRTMNWHRVK